MAAGRVDVSGRRVRISYSDKYVENCRGRAGVVELNHDRSYRNRHNSANGSPRLEDGEIPKYEGEFPLLVGKKRKFSPIVWDSEEKVSMKKGVVAATAQQSSRPPRAGWNDPDVGAAKYSGADFILSSCKVRQRSNYSGATGSEAGFVEKSSPAPFVKKLGGDHPECLGEEENFAETRSIFMSKWASDSPSDACLSDEEGSLEVTVHKRGFSAEKVGSSTHVWNGDRSRLSGSVEKDSGTGASGVEDPESDVHMDVDVDRTCGGSDGDDDDNYEETSDYCDQIEGSAAASHRGVDMLQGCRSVYEYERLNEISEGAYGKVFKAKDKKSGEIVALKKMKMNVGGYRQLEDYGFPITALREINILLSFHHPSIVNVKEVVMGGMDDIFMVMEYMEHDLKGLIKVMKQPFSTSEVKCLMLQLLEGVKYLHDNWVLHRDLKTSNLLLNNEGELKICDFGMSRLYGSPLKSYTSLVVTLWYRAPELLLGAKKYSTAVDMWSVGCIMAELLAKEPLFKGDNEIDQLSKIFKILGTPTEKIWPGFSKLPGAKAKFVNQPFNLLRKKFPASSFTGSSVLSDLGFDLLSKLLTYDPEKRLTVDDALNHPWFHEVPLPKLKAFMPTFPPQFAGNR